MRFVLGNRSMVLAGGMEVHLVTLADQLQRLGHETVIYSPELGPFADHVARRGIGIVETVRELPGDCDVVLSQDSLVAYDLGARFPDAFHTFRVCGDDQDRYQPPQVNGFVDLVVVLSDRYARLARACAVKAPLLRLRVPIDVERLISRKAIGEHPRRAVLLGNYIEREEVVLEACRRRGIEVTRIGRERQRYDLAAALADADIVFAKSRAALDAMACERAVYILDVFGGDGWVTRELYPSMEADHFAGQATDRVIGLADLERDLTDYDPRMGAVNRDLVLQHHDARQHAIEFLTEIDGRDPAPARPTHPFREISRLIALQWGWERMAREGWVEIQHVHAAMNHARAAEQRASAESQRLMWELESAQHERAALQAQIDEIRATRAWRFATRWYRLKLLWGGAAARS